MNNEYENGHNGLNVFPEAAPVAEQISTLQALPTDAEFIKRAKLAHGAIAFVHFDPSTAHSNVVEALAHYDDLDDIHRGLYVHILSTDDRKYSGRIIEGPFYNPDTLKRDSSPVQFIILNQGQGKVLTLPEYHGVVKVEILGEERHDALMGATRRPHPASPIIPYDTALMEKMLHLHGNIYLGLLDSYEDVFVRIDGNDKGVVPRNWLTVGTIGSGKSNTNQVFIEETTAAGYAQIVIDPEGEYIYMDQVSDAPGIAADLEPFERTPKGIGKVTVYVPPGCDSQREDATEFSVPFESLSPEIIVEITEMNAVQETRFSFLYEQAIRLLRKKNPQQNIKAEDLDVSRGFPGITLPLLINMLDEELEYYQVKKANGGKSTKGKKAKDSDEEESKAEMKIYCHKYQLKPIVQDHQDNVSYGALRKKLRGLEMLRLFDREDCPHLVVRELCQPGQLSVIDMSDSQNQQVVNIVIADLLSRLYQFKMALTEEENVQRKVFVTIEEAHGFISRQKKDKMEQTLEQLRRIARRGRKRWLALHFVTQSPQHLPPELFELANNKIIHQTTGSENIRVLKAAAGSVNEGIWTDVPTLGRGRAVIVSAQYPHPVITRIRPASSKRNYMV